MPKNPPKTKHYIYLSLRMYDNSQKNILGDTIDKKKQNKYRFCKKKILSSHFCHKVTLLKL